MDCFLIYTKKYILIYTKRYMLICVKKCFNFKQEKKIVQIIYKSKAILNSNQINRNWFLKKYKI